MESLNGNLFFSVIIKPKNIASAHLYSFVTAITLLNIIKNLSNNRLEVFIKWPNDVILAGKKVSGILLEQHKEHLIIGVGVNIIDHPEYVDSLVGVSATNLNENNIIISTEEFLESFLNEFKSLKAEFENNGFANIKDKFLNNAYLLNKNIKVRASSTNALEENSMQEGIFKTIDDEGNLILEINSTNHQILFGDVLGA